MKELLDDPRRLARRRASAIGRAVVVRTFGSAPRPEGAVLLRADDGRIAGSVSGGCVEGAAAEEIERARRDGHSRVIRYGISDEEAWDVGLACGGTIDVLVEPRGPGGRRRRRPRAGPRRRDAPAGRRAAAGVRAVQPGDGAPPAAADRRRAPTGSSSGSLGSPAADAALRRRRRATRSCGARRGRSRSATARSSSRRSRSGRGSSSSAPSRSPGRSSGFARELGYETIVIDGRASFATPERFPPDRSTGSSSAGRTRSPTRSASGRTTRSPS